MHLNDRVIRLPRRAAAMFATLMAALMVAAFGAALTPAVASAAPGENIPNNQVLVSKTGAAGTWVETSAVNETWWNKDVLIPGAENKTTLFVKNGSAVPVDAEFWLGYWSVSSGSAYFAVEARGTRVPNKDLSGNWQTNPLGAGIKVAETPLNPGEELAVTFITGLPEGGHMNATIDPSWSIAMEETETVSPQAPAAPTALNATPNPVIAGQPVVISGKTEPGTTVKVTASNGQSCDATVQPNGDFSCPITFTAEGLFTVTATAKKDGLASAASEPLSINVNADQPGGDSCELAPSLGSLGSLGLTGSLTGSLCNNGSLTSGSLGSLVIRTAN